MEPNAAETPKESQHVKELTEKDYEAEVVGASLPVVVDFYANDSEHCKALIPRFGAVAEKFGEKIRFLKVSTQDNQTLSKKLGVTASPTLVFFKNGKEFGERLAGDIKRTDLKARVEALLK